MEIIKCEFCGAPKAHKKTTCINCSHIAYQRQSDLILDNLGMKPPPRPVTVTAKFTVIETKPYDGKKFKAEPDAETTN